MTPYLSPRGQRIAAVAFMFLLVGALRTAPMLVMLGAVVIVMLLALHVWWSLSASLMRRRTVELAWWISAGEQTGGAVHVDAPFKLHVLVRNRGPRSLRVEELTTFASSALAVNEAQAVHVRSGHESEVHVGVTAHSAGTWMLHGAEVTFADRAGLFSLRAFFPNPLLVKVFPPAPTRASRMRALPRLVTPEERGGRHMVRRPGLSGDFRELRDYAPGDPFKMLAWKPSARRRKLLVRELETELVLTSHVLLDVGAAMREGPPGESALDQGIALASSLARAALESGDRLGFATWDTRLVTRLAPGAGHHHGMEITDRLLEVHSLVDEDLTDVTDGELVAQVALYLAHQEGGLDVRVRHIPGMNDPAWDRIATGPGAELYDLQAIHNAVEAILVADDAAQRRRGEKMPAWWSSEVHVSGATRPVMARLRVFCRRRGIELPFRAKARHGARSAGLAEVLEAALLQSRGQLVVLVSTLDAVLEDPARVKRALGLARTRRHRVVVCSPGRPAGLARAFAALGVPVVTARPGDSAAAVMHRVARGRRAA